MTRFISSASTILLAELNLLWMLIERNQRAILLWTRRFGSQTCARDCLGIEVIIWMLRRLFWDRIVHERLTSHFCDV